MRVGVFAAVFATFSSAASACVTADDLRQGITVTYADGRVERHQMNTSGSVTIEVRSGEDATRWILAHGLYYLEMTRIVAGQSVPELGYSISYPVDIARLPLPDGAGEWQVESRLTLPPDPPLRQRERYRYGPETELSVGGCTYRAIRVDSETWLADGYTTLSLHFLPDIGTSLFLNVDGSPDTAATELVAN